MQRGVRSQADRRVVAGLLAILLVSISAVAEETTSVPPAERALLDSVFVWENIDSAISVTRAISARYPDDPYPLHDLGRLLIRTQRPDLLPEAERVLLDCLAKNPTEDWVTAWATASLAYVYYETGRDSLAEAYCQRVIDMNATVNVTKYARRLMSRHRTSEAGYADWLLFESEHFRIHMSPEHASVSEENRTGLARAYESAYGRLAQFWCVEPDSVVELYIHGPDDAVGESGSLSHHAFPERREIHATWRATPGHELTHVFAYLVNPRQGSTVLSEGVAVVLDQWRSPFAIDMKAAEAMRPDRDFSVTRMSEQFDYRDDYEFAASFVCHLLREHGAERFLRLYRCQMTLSDALMATYGLTSADVETTWHEHLESLQAIPGELLGIAAVLEQPEQALLRLDRVLSICGDAPELMATKARFLNELGRHDEAMAAASAAVATRGDPTVPLYVAREGYVHLGDALDALGRKEEARAQYRAVIAIGAADNWTDEAREKLAALE